MTSVAKVEDRQFGKLIAAVVSGWQHSAAHKVEAARDAYVEADAILPAGQMNPDLSVLRHNVGTAAGLVVSIPPTENRVVTFVLPWTATEIADAQGMMPTVIDGNVLASGIRTLIAGFVPGHHRKNIVRAMPHVLVMSTGRCGTVSLSRLFDRSQLVNYHTYWWTLSALARWEMMCRLLAGRFDGDTSGSVWAASRAAEWLGAMASGHPMIGFNHLDTIFAPVFAAIHPQSKFVHLHRDPDKVFDSFFAKAQWSADQLCPLLYTFAPEFRFCPTGYAVPEQIAWYVHFTKVFAEAMGRVVGPDRLLDVSSDRLFAQDRDAIEEMLAFIGADIETDEAVAHFAAPINEKAHKVTVSAEDLIAPRRAFRAALDRLEDTGRL